MTCADVREPILTDDDRACWDRWMRTARVHATSRRFARRLDEARRVIDAAMAHAPVIAMWSGGKDSTVLVHLACVELGLRDSVEVRSEKDDLDYPGEREYVERLAREWSLRLRVYEPEASLEAWVAARAGHLTSGDDLHSRSSDLSRTHFYPLVERMNEGASAVLIGLRKEESRHREASRAAHGTLYRTRSGRWHATPLADWSGLDVLAYVESRGLELLPVYRCIAFMHRDEPWRVRKSWWLPGTSARYGQAAWLRRYYPSLYRRALQWFPDLGQVS